MTWKTLGMEVLIVCENTDLARKMNRQESRILFTALYLCTCEYITLKHGFMAIVLFEQIKGNFLHSDDTNLMES